MSDLTKKYFPFIKKHWYIPLMIFVGILMMAGSRGKESTETASMIISDRQYIQETESRLEMMLSELEGAGRCRVTVTLAAGTKKEYVRQEGSVLVVSDKDGNESPVISKENSPEIAGVTVACRSAERPDVRNRIIQAVSTVLGIGTNKICVVESNG